MSKQRLGNQHAFGHTRAESTLLHSTQPAESHQEWTATKRIILSYPLMPAMSRNAQRRETV